MTLYLVFSAIDGFGNDCYLSEITLSEEEARKAMFKTQYCGKPFIYLNKEFQESLLNTIEEVEDLEDIESAGIYKYQIKQ